MTAIWTHQLSKRYGDTLAFDSLDLEILEGEVYGYLGPYGAGKTTTIRRCWGDRSYRELLIGRFQLDTAKKVRALSKGNRQMVQLIAALATRADLLLLDEPTSGLDPPFRGGAAAVTAAIGLLTGAAAIVFFERGDLTGA